MIYPTTTDILRCVDQTLRTASDESMPRMAVKSALATSRHLIRHAELRTRLERSILLDDIEKATALLDRIAAYLESAGADSAEMARDIRAALAGSKNLLSPAADELDQIIDRARTLREFIYQSLARLQNFSGAQSATDAYAQVRQLMRDYMCYQIVQESRIIQPAFAGQGPRR